MGYSINWDNTDKTVVLQEYLHEVTKDDWYQLAKQSAQMLGTVSHTVHLIIDERNAQLVANSRDMQYLEKTVPPNEGICVLVVSRDQFLYKETVQRMREKFIPNTHHDAHFVETIQEARQFLQEHYGIVYSSTLDTK